MESPFLQAQGLLRYIGLFLSGVCHQLPEHCLLAGGVQLPLCARCMGTHLGALLALCNFWRWKRGRASRLPSPGLLALLGLLFVLWVADSVNSYVQFATGRVLIYNPDNMLRLLTGLGNGLLLSTLVLPMFNFSIWRQPSEARIVQNWRELGMIGLQFAALAIVMRSGPGWLLYPLLAASLAGVLLMLTIVNTVIAVIVLRRENSAANWRQALLPIGCGFLMAVAEIGIMALLRDLLAAGLSPAAV
jgi:uncharacterized membrane protein